MPATTSDPIARLAAICDESGLTRSAIAERAGMSPGDLSRMLSGRRRVSLDLVRRVLAACEAKWGDLDPPTMSRASVSRVDRHA